jgi:hypothetical protein
MNEDPIIAMIAEHRRIHKTWVNQKWPDDGPLFELYADVSERLFETPPSTIKGILALLDYIIKGNHDRYGYWGTHMAEGPSPILCSIRKGLTAVVKQSAKV